MAAMRAAGPVLSLVGGAAISLASVSYVSGESLLTAGVGAGVAGGLGALAFTVGFVICMARSRPMGRAGTVFVVHMCLTALNVTILCVWLSHRGTLSVTAVLAVVIAAQLAVGAVLLVLAANSGRRVGAAFALSLAAYLMLVGAAVFLTWKGW